MSVQVLTCFTLFNEKLKHTGKAKKQEKQNQNDQKEIGEGNNKSPSIKQMNNGGEIKIDPSIFVSLKKGSISTYYKIGEVLGEGEINVFL